MSNYPEGLQSAVDTQETYWCSVCGRQWEVYGKKFYGEFEPDLWEDIICCGKEGS
jgi:hypothetical protein